MVSNNISSNCDVAYRHAVRLKVVCVISFSKVDHTTSSKMHKYKMYKNSDNKYHVKIGQLAIMLHAIWK